MQQEIKGKLEEIVELLNDPDEFVLDAEVKEKVEKILTLLNFPDEIAKERKEYKDRMDELVVLVNKSLIDGEVEVDYCIPTAGIASDNCDILSSSPHILLTYAEDEYTTRTKKVSLSKTALQSTPEDLTKHVILAIEEFKDEMDDIQMG